LVCITLRKQGFKGYEVILVTDGVRFISANFILGWLNEYDELVTGTSMILHAVLFKKRQNTSKLAM